MSNNLIRKGLAIGASVSLALAGLVGFAAPAHAAGTVYLEPAEGSTYNVPITEPFALGAYFDDAAQVAAEKVYFKVTAAVGDLTIGTATSDSGFNTLYSATANRVAGVSTGTTTTTVRQLALNAGSTYYVVQAANNLAPVKHYLALVPLKTTATFSVTVQAWMDLDEDGVIDSGEQASDERTVTFVKASDITATTTVAAYGVGDTSVSASYKTTPVLNGAQIANSTNVVPNSGFGATLTNVRSGNTAGTTVVTWDETNQEFDAVASLPSVTADASNPITLARSSTVATALVTSMTVRTGDSVRVTVAAAAGASLATDRSLIATHDGAGEFTWTVPDAGSTAATASNVRLVIGDNSYNVVPTYAGATIGTAVGAVVATPVADSSELAAQTTAAQYISASSASAMTVDIRELTGTASATYTAYDDKAVALAAGKSVRIVVKTLTSIASGSATINGTKVTAAGQVITAVTNASGSVAIALSSTETAAADLIALEITAEDVASTLQTLTFDWEASVYKVMDLNDTADHGTLVAARAATKGGSYTFNIQVHDQWMQVAPATVASHLDVAVTGRTVSTSKVALASGRATVTVADGALSTGAAAVQITPQLLSGSTYGSVASATTPNAVNVYFYDQTDVVAITAAGTDSATYTQTRTAATAKAVNGSVSAAFPFDGTASTPVKLKGSVTNSLSGVAKAGALVTISGPSSLLFEAQDGVTAFGTLSYYDADGALDVDIWSNIAQADSVVTVTSGGVSKTVKVSFLASTSQADIATASVVAVKSIKAGRTANVTIKVADKFGNAVNHANTVKVTMAGVGYLTSYPTTLTQGSATVTLVTGAGDFGKSVITVVADGKTSATTDDLTVTGAVWVGPVANAVAGVKNGRVKIEAYRAKGKTVNVFVGRTKVASYTSNKANFSKSVKVKSGTRNVRVVIVGPSNDFRGAITVK